MKRKLEISELIFKIISYTLLTMFALCCLYPFVYAVSASISGRSAVEYGSVVLVPKDLQFEAFARMFKNNMFWNAYSNTLFLTLYGTLWSMFTAILGAYAQDSGKHGPQRAVQGEEQGVGIGVPEHIVPEHPGKGVKLQVLGEQHDLAVLHGGPAADGGGHRVHKGIQAAQGKYGEQGVADDLEDQLRYLKFSFHGALPS